MSDTSSNVGPPADPVAGTVSSSPLAQGDAHMQAGRWEDAAGAYRRALADATIETCARVHVHTSLGHAASHLGRWEEAADAYRTARDLAPDRAELSESLGNALLKAGAFGRAAAAYEVTLELDARANSARVNLGHAFSLSSDWDKAVDAYSKAVEQEPGVASTHENLGDALARLKRWADAEAAYRRAFELDSTAPTVRSKLASMRTRVERTRRAGSDSLIDVTIDLEVTSVCDARCGFCPREVMPDKRRLIDLATVERLAADVEQNPVDRVVLCGIGESTVHPELDRIVELLSATGTRVEMTTHGGARMDVSRLARLVERGLSGLNLSLNANTAETHRAVMRLRDFDVTVKNAADILAWKGDDHPDLTVHVSFVVCGRNEHEVTAFVERWRPLGPSRIWLHPLNRRAGLLSPNERPVDMTPYVRLYEDDDLVLVDVFSEVSEDEALCKIAENMIFISADGETRLCAMDYRRVTSSGAVGRASIADMHRDKLERYVAGEMDGFCRGCEFRPPRVGKGVLAVV